MPYSLRIVGRGEDMEYHDEDGNLALGRTYSDVNRLFCDDTKDEPLARRERVILNLCDYFDTLSERSIFVIDEADRDRQALEELLKGLIVRGHKIYLEYDSAEKRDRREDEMFLSILRAGKKLSIDDVEIPTEEDYWRWKHERPQR